MDSILVLVGPSAVGKTTVMTRILELYGNEFSPIRSATTRAPRGDSFDGEYIYLSREEFLSSVSRGELLEYMEYGGNLYGTPKSEVEILIERINKIREQLPSPEIPEVSPEEQAFLEAADEQYEALSELQRRRFRNRR